MFAGAEKELRAKTTPRMKFLRSTNVTVVTNYDRSKARRTSLFAAAKKDPGRAFLIGVNEDATEPKVRVYADCEQHTTTLEVFELECNIADLVHVPAVASAFSLDNLPNLLLWGVWIRY